MIYRIEGIRVYLKYNDKSEGEDKQQMILVGEGFSLPFAEKQFNRNII